MAKDFAEAFYKSKRWRSCRAAFISMRIQIDGGACQRCGIHAGYIVHHKVLLTAANINDPMVSLNADNLEYLCKACHDLEPGHFIDSSDRPPVRCLFSDDGQPVPIPPVADE